MGSIGISVYTYCSFRYSNCDIFHCTEISETNVYTYIYICVFIHNYIFSMVFLYGTNLVLIGISNGIILSNFWDFGELFEFYWDIFRDNGDISLPGSSRDGVLSN